MSTPNEPTRPFEPHDDSGEPNPTPPYPAGPQPSRTGAIGRHRTAILTGVIGLLVGGVVGGLIGWGATDDSNGSSAAAPAATQHKQHQQVRPGAHGVRGSITAINGDSWTVHAQKGTDVTVTITSSTVFGTAKKPEQASDFAVGDNIVVAGTQSGDTVTAARVVKPVSHPNQSPAPTSQPG